MLASEIIDGINERIPESLQESWDNCGLQLGDKNQQVERVMVALEVTHGVIDEAIEKKCQMIITHHPFFFTPIRSLDFTSFRGKLARRLIENEMLVYSAHTNLDQMPFGISDALAKQLGIGKYAFLQGTSAGKDYNVSTDELVTYELIAMENSLHETGYGMVGELEKSCSLAAFANDVAKNFACPVLIHGDRDRQVKVISCCGGEGADLIPLAAACSDLYVTGDIRASKAQMAIEAGLALLVLPHRATEKPGVDQFQALLEAWFADLTVFGTNSDDVVETSWAISFADR